MNGIVETLKCFVAKRASTVLTPTGIPRLDILRVTSPTSLFPEVYQPLVSLILQGQKRLVIGNKVITYGAGDTFIASIDLPVIGEITTASPKAPYLAVRLTFERAIVAAMLRDDPAPISPGDERSFCVDRASDTLADAWLRMLRLTDEPTEIDVMAPMLEREIMFRLLRGPQAAVIRQVAAVDGRVSQVRHALAWIRKEYASPLRIEQLAAIAHMSPSSFQRSFKASTGFSPIQYQKHLRLYEARRLLFAQPGDVAAVALTVGYESLSQFTREYGRLFGAPPARDARALRATPKVSLGMT